MSYTAAAALGIVVALVLDLAVLRTRLVATWQWWAAYGIVFGFQLLTNGWLTGRLIVTYDPDAILGAGSVPFLGDGRIAYAPVEDLGFGFALVLATCVLWVWWGRRLARDPDPSVTDRRGARRSGSSSSR